ncbi:ArsR/SmtB family transcription factor [Pimelobacter simplex]|nr:metalloregulator ArsR/SmtB family transcription factor [Pimelobacter simplex]
MPVRRQASSQVEAPQPAPALALAHALRPALTKEQAEDTAQMLSVVSNPTRLQILSLIHHSPSGTARVADLTAVLELSQPTVSHHMKVMHGAGIVAREPVGREVWYSIVPARLAAIADLLR